MTVGGIVYFVLLFWLIGGIVLLIFSFISFKKRKIIRAVILAVIGIVFLIPPAYTSFSRIHAFIQKNNSLSEYDYAKEFTQINKGFSELYKSNKENVIGMNFEINGFVNGKGKILIIHQPYEENNGIMTEIKGNINKTMKNIDWYNSECLIKYIPDNEFVEGNILIKIQMY